MKDLTHIAVIDIGKTNAKLVLFDAKTQRQLAVLSRPNVVINTEPYPHYDVDGLWQFILDGLTKLQHDHGIDGISITTHGATAALVADDELIMPILDYEFDGVEAEFGDYDKLRPDFSETLSPKLPIGLNLAAQIYWQSQQYSDEFAKVTDIIMYPQFWAWKLTGIKASEVTSLGTHTDLWNPNESEYSSLVVAQNWQKLFPPLRKASDILGNVRAEICQKTGLETDIPVICGIHDSNASLLPYLGAIKPPFSVISSGTWTIHMTVGGSTDHLDAARDSLANVDAFGRAVPTARFMGGREYEVIMGDDSPYVSAKDIDYIIENEIFLLPSFTQGVGPFPQSVGKWVGDVDDLTLSQRGAAVALNLALMSQECLKLAECGDTIIVEGPLCSSFCYMGILTTLIDRPVHGSSDTTGTSVGASMLFESGSAPLELNHAVKRYVSDKLAAYGVKWLGLIG